MIGQIVKKWQPFFEIQDGGDIYAFRPHRYVQIKVSTNFFDDGSATTLKNILPVEPLSRKMNARFVILNKKCNFN